MSAKQHDPFAGMTRAERLAVAIGITLCLIGCSLLFFAAYWWGRLAVQ